MSNPWLYYAGYMFRGNAPEGAWAAGGDSKGVSKMFKNDRFVSHFQAII